MLGRLVVLIALVVAVLLLMRWFSRTPPPQVAKILRRFALYGGIALLVLLAATGRLHWLFAALGAAIPLVQRLLVVMRVVPLVKQVLGMAGRGAPGGGGPQASTISTRFLRVSLDHATGAMDGVVLEGSYEGRSLSELELDQLRDLLHQCRREDGQSAAVLEAYLDRSHGDAWRGAGDEPGASRPPPTDGTMTREEAYAVLGLEPGADATAIKEAHRRLMQKLHPDRGGSDYLAAKINRAKDLLLADG